MAVHQCPRCELRFRNEAELNFHMTSDHGASPQSVERFRYGGAKEQEPIYSDLVEDEAAQPRRVLIVGSASLRAQRLQDTLAGREDDGDVVFHLVVPAVESTPVAGDHSWFDTVGRVPHPEEHALGADALARHRLDEALQRLREVGLEIEGSVGDADPMRAAASALQRFRADEIVLATLPKAQSGWLDADLHKEMERRLHVPVTVVPAA